MVDDLHLGAEPGGITSEAIAAVRLVAQSEGFFLDPTDTGRAAAGLIDLIHRSELFPDQSLVLLHTGGTPALFAYNQALMQE